MQERVQEFLERSEAECRRHLENTTRLQQEDDLKKRDELLIRLGLCEREEAKKIPDGQSDWRWDSEKVVYYRYKALSVSDEEFEAVKNARDKLLAAREDEARLNSRHRKKGLLYELSAPKSSTKVLRGNRVAVALRICAWILFVVGINLGIISGDTREVPLSLGAADNFDFLKMLYVWAAFFVGGLLLYGVSEIILLLSKQAEKESGDEE